MSYHNKNKKETLNDLDVKENIGLTKEKVEENQKKYGKNTFTPPKEKSFLYRLIQSLNDAMLIILMIAAGVSIATNIYNLCVKLPYDFSECVGIFFAIALSSTISLIMEGSSAKAFAALNKIGQNIKIKVLRDNKITYVCKEDITVGDIVILETGDKIPADGRLIECDNLRVDESMLTGESNTIKKDSEKVLSLETELAQRINLVYGGTNISEGRGRMVVTSIGDNTEMGKIAKELKEDEESETPLQEKLGELGKKISIIGIVAAGFIFLLELAKMYFISRLNILDIQNSFIRSVALIVAAVPEGLPTMIAITLALNMKKMAKENALVKKMVACETIGSINVICSDKTGTLTENKMTVRDLWTNGHFEDPALIKEENELILNFALNGTANIEIKNGKTEFIGNPTECSLLSCIDKNENLNSYSNIREEYETIHQYAFSSDRKMMSTITKKDGQLLLLSKGAPEKILSLCKKAYINGEIVDLTKEVKEKIEKDIISLQEKARRVIGFAYSNVEECNYEEEQEKLENDLIFNGFVGIADPLRADVYDAICECVKSGISVKMLTGDNKVTANAIANELGLVKEDSLVLEASEVDKMTDEELIEKLPHIVVIARSKPLTKMRVVELLKASGNSVAVTGDGINDAPALKKADVGIAMGIAGTEVSKEAADIVLLDDAFSTIVKAVRFGRSIYENFQRFIVFQLTVNVVAFLIAIAAEIFNFQMPFTTLQLLWVNIIMDGPPALTLGLEKVREHVMEKKPIPRNANIITKDMWKRIVTNGLFMVCMLLVLQIVNPFEIPQEQMTTAMFTSFVLFQLFNAFNAREFEADSIFPNFFTNKYLLIAIGVSFLVQVLVVTIGGSVFKTVPLQLITWLQLIGYSLSIIIFSELVKLVKRLIKK